MLSGLQIADSLIGPFADSAKIFVEAASFCGI